MDAYGLRLTACGMRCKQALKKSSQKSFSRRWRKIKARRINVCFVAPVVSFFRLCFHVSAQIHHFFVGPVQQYRYRYTYTYGAYTMMMGRRSFLLTAAATLLLSALTNAAEAEISVKRKGNLDYMDVETVKYYLTAPNESYNVAIMFFAQWCQNCHHLAPVWDQIGRHINTGTVESNLILGLFDCEADYEHMEVCSAAGITHYPTLQYYSLAGQTLQRKQPRHVTKFAGNWQYGDAVLDWLTVNTALSQWHRADWGKRLRRLLTGRSDPSSTDKAGLPIGVPAGAIPLGSTARSADVGSGVGAGAAAGGAASRTSMDDAATQKLMKELQQDAKDMQDLAVRSTVVVDAMLYPLKIVGPTAEQCLVTENSKSYTDLYKYLDATKGWTSTDNAQEQILRSCAMEIGLDYCQRLSEHHAEDWITGFASIEDITDADLKAFQGVQAEKLAAVEPYCGLLEDCLAADFKEEKCRPAACPYQDPTACRYLTACFTEQLQTEYAIAMGLMEDPGKPTTTALSSSSSS